MLTGVRLSQIASFCGGKLVQSGNVDPIISVLSSDSRSLKGGELFAAIRGEKFDGHQYLQDVAKKGAVAVLAEKDAGLTIPTIVVPDTVKALAKIGSAIRDRFKGKVIAVTGSAGKSSTKDAIAVVLGKSTVKSPASFNNLLGVSQTLWLVQDSTPALVLEMGMNALGEIKELCETFRPEYALITNIGDAHIGKLGGVKGIFTAKKEMFDFLATSKDTKGVALSLDHPLVREAYKQAFGQQPPNTITYSLSDSNADVYIVEKSVDAETGALRLAGHVSKEKFSAVLPVFGLHHAENAAAAMAVGLLVGEDSKMILERLPSIRPAYHRGEVVALSGDRSLIDESYNSNPTALVSSLSTLAELNPQRRRLLVLGEMRELGEFGESLHRKVGETIVQLYEEKHFPFVMIGVGGLTRHLIDAVKSQFPEVPCFQVENHQEAVQRLQQLMKPRDIIFVKGSRGIELDLVVKALTQT